MPRLRVEEIRRQQLIDATISAIHDYGFGDTTVVKISEKAGISAGNIHHYFGGKDGLLEAAMQSLLRRIKAVMVERLAASQQPLPRLRAVIGANLDERLFRPDICRAWLNFWSQAPHRPALARIEHINATRFRRNLVHELRKLVSPEEAHVIANEVVAMTDGLWVQRAQADGGLAPDAAQALVFRYLENRIGLTSPQ